MNTELSQKQIGERLTKLRKIKGLSQEDLAKSVKLSRPSLAQIELGNRTVDILELQRFSMILSFSLDDFVSGDFLNSKHVGENEEDKPIQTNERISVPILNINKFKTVLLYILERCAGKPNAGETVLHKLLYFSDFNYYELYEEHLTGANYRKLPYGLVVQKLDTMISEMLEKGQIQRIKTEYAGKIQSRYLPLTKADLTGLKASEKDVIDRVIEQMSDWSAVMITNYLQGDKPWKATSNNEEINYELAFYRRPPYSVRLYAEDEQDSF